MPWGLALEAMQVRLMGIESTRLGRCNTLQIAESLAGIHLGGGRGGLGGGGLGGGGGGEGGGGGGLFADARAGTESTEA